MLAVSARSLQPLCHDFVHARHSVVRGELSVDVQVGRLGRAGLPGVMDAPLVVGEDERVAPVGQQQVADGGPASAVPRLPRTMLDVDQEMVGEHGDKQMRFASFPALMVYGACSQVGLETAEGGLGAGQRHIRSPDPLRPQFVVRGADHVCPVQRVVVLGALLHERLPGEGKIGAAVGLAVLGNEFDRKALAEVSMAFVQPTDFAEDFPALLDVAGAYGALQRCLRLRGLAGASGSEAGPVAWEHRRLSLPAGCMVCRILSTQL